LVLKKVCTEEEWQVIKEDIWYEFLKDNNFNELKEAELIANRIQTLNFVDPFVGRYYSKEWVQKNVLHLTDEEIEEMSAQIDEEGDDAAPVNGMAAQPGQSSGGNASALVDQNGNPMAPIPMAPSTPVVPGTPMVVGPDGMTPIPQQPQVPPKFELQPEDMELLP
jgi:hypothetical protein